MDVLRLKYMTAVANTTIYSNSSCGIPTEETWHIFRDVNSGLPWPGSVFGTIVLGVYFWCTNQVRMKTWHNNDVNSKKKNKKKGGGGGPLGSYSRFLQTWQIMGSDWPSAGSYSSWLIFGSSLTRNGVWPQWTLSGQVWPDVLECILSHIF